MLRPPRQAVPHIDNLQVLDRFSRTPQGVVITLRRPDGYILVTLPVEDKYRDAGLVDMLNDIQATDRNVSETCG